MEALNYTCKIPHHEYENITLDLEDSKIHDDITIDITIEDGDGFNGKNSRIILTAKELREIMFVTNKFLAAKLALKDDGGQN